MSSELDVLNVNVENIRKDISEIKESTKEIREEHKILSDKVTEHFVRKEDYDKNISRLHNRIDKECVSKTEFNAVKLPLWVIAVSIIGVLVKWIFQIVEKMPVILQNIPPSP